jgi:hypothetical protein
MCRVFLCLDTRAELKVLGLLRENLEIESSESRESNESIEYWGRLV